jgi:hypothetical protein
MVPEFVDRIMTTPQTASDRDHRVTWRNTATVWDMEVLAAKPPMSIPDAMAAALAHLYGPPTTTTASTPEARSVEEKTSDSAASPAADHRRFPRRSAGGYVSVVRWLGDRELTPEWTDWLMQTTGLTGELVDLSRSGLALLLLQPLSVGDVVVARLSQQDSAETLDVIAEVVRVVDLGDHRWKIMTQFQTPLEFDDAYDFAHHDQDAEPLLFK